MEWLDQSVSALWTATYEPALGWSVPRLLVEASEIGWSSPAIAGGDLAPPAVAMSLIATPTPGVSRRVLVLVRFEGDELRTATVETSLTPVYSSVASRGADVFLGFIAPAALLIPRRPGERVHDANSVLFQVSSDGGATWRPPVLVSRSGAHAAYDLRALLAPAGGVHLLWRQERADTSDVLRHVASTDGGRTWSVPTDLELPSMTAGIEAVIDPCGTLLVAYEHLDPSTGHAHVDYVTWRDRWSPVEHLFLAWRANGIHLHRAPAGRLVLAFLAQPASAPMFAPVRTMYSELPLR